MKPIANDRLTELLNEIEHKRNKARDIVGLIAGTGMAGGYQKDANQERDAYYLWSGAAIIGFIGLIGFAIWLFVSTAGEVEFGWPKLWARFVAIVAFGLFAAYAGRMAMKHRESERDHRHKQLALESVNAFIENLEPDVQKQVKQKMADAFFTQHRSLSELDHDVAPTTIESLIKLLRHAIDRIPK